MNTQENAANFTVQRTGQKLRFRPSADLARYASKMMRLISIAAALLSLMSFANADENGGLSPNYSKCLAKAGAVDPAVAECMSAEYALQDRRLNTNYKALMAKLSDERKKQLQEAQRLWLKFVEANCDFYYAPNGGTAARMMAYECSVKARAQRARELKDLAKWE